MKAIQLINHPVTIIISFLFILISGEHWGGFYMLYLLLALPHGGLHALLGFAGVLMLVVAMNKKIQISRNKNSSLLRLFGVLFLIASLLSFFTQKGAEYNYGTFNQLMPVITLVLFIVLATCMVMNNVMILTNRKISALR